MSLVAAGFVPHSPTLIPAVAKDNLKRLAATVAALNNLSERWQKKKLETLLIFSPTGPLAEKNFTANIEPELTVNFGEFGDLATEFKVASDLELAQEIKNHLPDSGQLQLINFNPLDYGAGVILFYLTKKLPRLKVLPFYPSRAALAEGFAFGRQLQTTLQLSTKKIGVIACGALSQRLAKLSPAGYTPAGRGFDKKIIAALLAGRQQEILTIPAVKRQEVEEFGLTTLAPLLGVVEGIKKTPKVLAYETPFGAGMLTLEFNF